MSETKKESMVPMVTAKELSMVENNLLNEKQLGFLLSKTPKQHIYQRPGKGGGKWDYVTGTYVKKVLNLIFGWNWSHEVREYKFDLNIGQVFVLGRLTCKIVDADGKEHVIVKEQFGRVDIKFQKKDPTQPVDLGNDLKAATTDSLKKCASELGVAADVYSPQEFKELQVVPEETKAEKVMSLYEEVGELLSEEEHLHMQRIIERSETASYSKAIKILTKYKEQKEQKEQQYEQQGKDW